MQKQSNEGLQGALSQTEHVDVHVQQTATAALEALHPVRQEVRCGGIVIAIRAQPEFRRVCDPQCVTSLHANEGTLERGGEIGQAFASRGDGDSRFSRSVQRRSARYGAPRRCRPQPAV